LFYNVLRRDFAKKSSMCWEGLQIVGEKSNYLSHSKSVLLFEKPIEDIKDGNQSDEVF
jgi:hypothetical protein